MTVQQFPTPPTPPTPPDLPQVFTIADPGIWSPDDILKVVALSLLGASVMVWMIARGPIGQAIGAVIRRWLGGAGDADETLRTELDALRQRVGELEERQDFADRILAQARRERVLPGTGDGRA